MVNCHQSAVVTVLPLTPLQELLALHPAPWRVETHKNWRGKPPADPVLYDARWHVVELCDDPSWFRALAEAVNLAAAMIEDVTGAITLGADCAGK